MFISSLDLQCSGIRTVLHMCGYKMHTENRMTSSFEYLQVHEYEYNARLPTSHFILYHKVQKFLAGQFNLCLGVGLSSEYFSFT
jgi:hypothetical protein